MAYEVLSNPEKRKLYDQAGEQGIKEGGSGGGGGMNPMDIFDMFFGGGGGDPFGRGGSFGRQRGPRRTKNLVHQLSVSLEDMYNGTVRKLALQKNVICDGCEGIGGKPGAVQKCPNCRGTGMQVRIQQLGPGMMQAWRCPEMSQLQGNWHAGSNPTTGAWYDASLALSRNVPTAGELACRFESNNWGL